MTWRDELRKVKMPDGRVLIGASFRGVPFFVENAEWSGGRRTVVHEFPYRDLPYVEDLGRKARSFRIDGYVLGADYLAQKNALLDACDGTEGPGQLVHPYHGVLSVICTGVSCRDSRNDGGLATFAFEFAEAPDDAAAPSIVVDPVGLVDTSADAAIVAASAELDEQYDADGLPAFALQSSEDALSLAAETLAEVLAPVTISTQELAELTGKVAAITLEVASLVRQPALALEAFKGALAVLVSTVEASPGAVIAALIAAYDVDLSTPVITETATRVRELANQTALIAALKRVLAIEAARLAPLVQYVSIQEALSTRGAVAEMIEDQCANADDTAYPALVDLRTKVLRGVPGSNVFASEVDVSRDEPIPSLVLAYQLYGSVDSELDIVARNKVAHPGFVAGDLKVLSDD